MTSNSTVISLFCGAGGSSLGYQWAGFKELLAIDFDQNAVDTFKLNFECPIWLRDIKTVQAQEILDFCKIKKGELDILDGSPPCQGFSTAGKRKVTDDRNDLFKEYVRLIDGLQPRVFVMENVSGMIKGKMKGMFIEIMKTLKSLNYQVKCKLMNAKYYNVPQSRERVIFIGVRKDLGIEPNYPVANKKLISIRKACHGLKNEMIESINHIWIDESLMGKNTKTYKKALKAKQGKKYAGHQKRLIWNKCCPTLCKPSSDGMNIPPYLRNSHCHPIYTRTLSVRELARLSSYPDEFKFTKGMTGANRIGNSVPPKFMQAIAEHIRDNILNPKNTLI